MEQKTNADIRKDFQAYWLKVLLPALQKKESLRQKYLSSFWFLFWLALFIIPMICVTSYVFAHQILDPNILFLIIAGAIFMIQRPYGQYKKKIKQDVMPLFVGFFDGFKYELGKGLTLDEIEDSGIFPSFDECLADDCFEGVFDGVNIRVMEERLSAYHRTSKGSKKVEVFKGIAVELDLKKKFKSKTIVLKDMGVFNRFQSMSKPERVKLEDVRFEKMFEVYSTDQIEARYLLTPAFMERIIKLKDLYKGKSVQFSFWAGKLLIAIPTGQDMFEPFSFFKTNMNKAKIDTVFEQFLTIFEIIHTLKISNTY